MCIQNLHTSVMMILEFQNFMVALANFNGLFDSNILKSLSDVLKDFLIVGLGTSFNKMSFFYNAFN